MLDHAFLLQVIEGLCNFLRLHQGIRTVQQEHIHIVSLQAFQAVLYGCDNVLLGEVKKALADAAFGLNHQLIAHAWAAGYHLTKHFFSLAGGIDVRMVKKINTCFQSTMNMNISFFDRQFGNPHTA
ncbi:hypothetical protein D3C75_1115080 [compost metagenome]